MQTLPGKPGSPLNGLGGWGAWGYSTSSYVLGTLALEDAVKMRASIARRDAGGMGRRKNQILGEPEKLSSLNETKSLSSILGCEEKTEISNLQELIERSHQLSVFLKLQILNL